MLWPAVCCAVLLCLFGSEGGGSFLHLKVYPPCFPFADAASAYVLWSDWETWQRSAKQDLRSGASCFMMAVASMDGLASCSCSTSCSNSCEQNHSLCLKMYSEAV